MTRKYTGERPRDVIKMTRNKELQLLGQFGIKRKKNRMANLRGKTATRRTCGWIGLLIPLLTIVIPGEPTPGVGSIRPSADRGVSKRVQKILAQRKDKEKKLVDRAFRPRRPRPHRKTSRKSSYILTGARWRRARSNSNSHRNLKNARAHRGLHTR